MSARIVIVDDEEDLREPVAEYLRSEGLDVSVASGGAELDAIMAEAPVDLVVLDVNMPGEDGFSIARRLRAEGDVCIIMLTTKRDLVDRVVGLEVGADDYIAKPFELRELLARIRAVLRRGGSNNEPRPAAVEDIRAPSPEGGYAQEFWVQTGQGQTRIPIEAIDWIEAAKDYVILHTAQRSHMLRVTMTALEQQLDPARMMRVHRSSFVRPDAVRTVSQIGRGLGLVLQSGTMVQVGPRHADDVRRRLKG